MQDLDQSRRNFIRKTATVAGGISLAANLPLTAKPASKNKLPKWKGFNLLDFFSPNPSDSRPQTQEEYFKWMSDWGFNFVRIPMAYPYYLKIDHSKNIKIRQVRKIDKRQTDKIEELIYLAHKYNLHASLNLHRAPGFCVNAGFHEPYNLWEDEKAQEDFFYHWKFWARRFKHISRDKISFDLVNEPCTREDMNDQLSSRSPMASERRWFISSSTIRTLTGGKVQQDSYRPARAENH